MVTDPWTRPWGYIVNKVGIIHFNQCWGNSRERESPDPLACGVHLAGDTEGKKERRSITDGVLEYESEGENKARKEGAVSEGCCAVPRVAGESSVVKEGL